MDSYEIIITPDAEADLFEIRDYIAYMLRDFLISLPTTT